MLAQLIPEMCKAAGIQCRKTGHSGKDVLVLSITRILVTSSSRSVQATAHWKHFTSINAQDLISNMMSLWLFSNIKIILTTLG